MFSKSQFASVNERGPSSGSMARTLMCLVLMAKIAAAAGVSVTPGSANLLAGQSHRFAAAVAASNNQGTTWSIDPSVGSIGSDGTYTAPSQIAADQTVSVIATSVADQSRHGVGIVNLRADLQFTISDTSLTGLSYKGQSYYTYVPTLVNSAVFRSPAGLETPAALTSTSSAVRTQGTNYFQHIYSNGKSHQFTVKLVWNRSDARTLKVDAYITNNDSIDDLARISLSFLPVLVPGPTVGRYDHQDVVADQYSNPPAAFLLGNWGSLAVWQDYPTMARIIASYGTSTQTTFAFALHNYVNRGMGVSTSGLTKYYEAPITPGETQHLTYYLRFGGSDETAATLAPQAFASYRAAFPNLVNWPDRRPIGNWFIAEGTKRSSLNPRGYLSNPTLDISNKSNFRSAVLTLATQIVTRMNGMTPKPQGIIIWDLEGQEFIHAFTYVGYPSKLPELAPEMDAIADDVFSTFKASGYRVGVTLRPQSFGTGTALPATCHNSSNYIEADKFVKTDAAPPFRGYICTAPNTWTVAPMSQPGEQTYSDDDATLIATLEKKIAYARSRWNATLFYIDTTVWISGSPFNAAILRTLAQEFPDVLLIPEEQTDYHYGTSAPYDQANMGVPQTPDPAKSVYPGAFSVINVADADFKAPNMMQNLINGVSGGDILLFRAYYGAPEIAVLQAIYAAAAAIPR